MKGLLTGELSRSQIEDLLFRALRSIYLFEREEIRQFGVNYQQMYILKLLKRKSPFRITEIAHSLRVPAFAATRLIKELSSMDLIAKSRDLKDRRNVFVRMTPQGEQTLKKIETHIVDLMIARLDGYPVHEIRTLIEFAGKLDELLMVSPDPDRTV